MVVCACSRAGASEVSLEASSSSSSTGSSSRASSDTTQHAAPTACAPNYPSLPLHVLEHVLEMLLATSGHDRRSTRGFVSALCTCTSWRAAGTAMLFRSLSSHGHHPDAAFVFQHPLQLETLTPSPPALTSRSSSRGSGGDKSMHCRLVQCTLRREVHSSALGMKVHRFTLSQDAAGAGGGGGRHHGDATNDASSKHGSGSSSSAPAGTFLLAAQRGLLHSGTSIHLDRTCSTAPIACLSSGALGGAFVLTSCSKPARASTAPLQRNRSSSKSSISSCTAHHSEAGCSVLAAAAPTGKLCDVAARCTCSCSSSSDAGNSDSDGRSSSLTPGRPLLQLLPKRRQPVQPPLMALQYALQYALQLNKCMTLPRRLSVALAVPVAPGRPLLLPLATHWATQQQQHDASGDLISSSSRGVMLVSKQPRWSRSNSCYTLNFNGRVKISSVKNLQLVVGGASDDAPAGRTSALDGAVVLQFGKVAAGEGAAASFILDFDPRVVTCLQAFAVALSTFGSRLL